MQIASFRPDSELQELLFLAADVRAKKEPFMKSSYKVTDLRIFGKGVPPTSDTLDAAFKFHDAFIEELKTKKPGDIAYDTLMEQAGFKITPLGEIELTSGDAPSASAPVTTAQRDGLSAVSTPKPPKQAS